MSGPKSIRPRSTSRIPIPHRDPMVAPGTLRSQAETDHTQVRVWCYGPDGLQEDVELDPEILADLRHAGRVVWVHIVGADDAEVFQKIGSLFHIHPLALEDVMSDHQRPKADDYDHHGLVVLRAPLVGENLELAQVGILLGHCFVVSVQHHQGHWFLPVERRLHTRNAKLLKRSSDYLVHALIDAILDSYLPLVETYRDRLEALEDRILEGPDELVLLDLHDTRHDLYSLRRVLQSIRDALADSVRGEETLFSEGLRVYLRDCEDHTAQLLDSVDACAVMVTGLVELHNSQLNQHMNEVMKWLSLISTIFIPLSFIVGVYGMNFDPDTSQLNMPELRWRYGYPFALFLLAGTTAGILLFFRYRGWIGRGKAAPRSADRRSRADLTRNG